jgi:hypothetical protein
VASEQDVSRPADRRGGGEGDSEQIRVTAERSRQPDDADGRHRRPEQRERTAPGEHRHAEGPEELHRHRNPERNPIQRRVDRKVHDSQRDPEADRQPEVRPRATGQRRSPQRQQHRDRQQVAQQHRTREAHPVEYRDRYRGAALDRDDRKQHQPDRRGRPALAGLGDDRP